jgi:cytidylate kinase
MNPMRDSTIANLLDRQARLWESQQQPMSRDVEAPRANVTISGQPLAGAREVAQRLAELSGWEVFDRQILEALHESDALGRRVLDSLDERLLTYREDLLYHMFVPGHVSSTGYLHRLSQLVLSLAMRGQIVFVGRGAGFIVPNEHRVAVLVVRSFDSRLDRMLEHGDESNRTRARRALLRLDRERSEFVRRSFHCEVNDPQAYDLCVNLDTLSLDAAARIVLQALRSRFPDDFQDTE